MSKSKKNKGGGIVYSTNPNFQYSNEDEEPETLAPEDQLLEVKFEKKGRGGKTAVIISGFEGSQEDLKTLAKYLKTQCGVGGNAKNGDIIIQGNVRDKVMELLKNEGYRVKRVGG